MTSQKRIRIAQIGMGHDHADAALRTFCRLKDRFEVVGWCAAEGEEKRVSECLKYVPELAEVPRMSLDELLDIPGLEAVAVETEDYNLTRYALAAAKRGFHIQMDKPGGVSQAEYESLLSVMKTTGKVFQTGYMYRYNPAYLALLDEMERGGLGAVYSVEAHMDCEHPAAKRAWLGSYPGGMMYYLGCHLVDLVLRLQGVPEEVHAFNTASGFDGITAADVGFAVFRYANGVSFVKTSACEPGGFLRRQLVVCGQKGTYQLLPFERYTNVPGLQETGVRLCRSGKGWHDDGEHSVTAAVDRYEAMMTGFADMIDGAYENPYTLEYEARLHRVLLAACGETIDYKGEIQL